jgi:tetratricopeptide (TPR) repeat protein
MATINQISKQIETATKRVAEYGRKVEMYRERAEKACKAANVAWDALIEEVIEKNGHKLLSYRIEGAVLFENISFDAHYKITINFQYMKENEHKMAKEQRALAAMEEQRAKMVKDAEDYKQATAGLEKALEQSLQGFKTVWFNKMEKWYRNHHAFINGRYAEAKSKYERAKACQSYFDMRRGWRWRYTSVARFLERVIKQNAEIVMDDAACKELPVYLAKKAEETALSWANGVKLLTDKCHKFGLNEAAMKVVDVAMSGKGFEAIITDGTARVVDVRVIWAAEYSELVTPHVRYIATERKTKR